MNDNLVRRVKSRLRTQCYVMNDSWLTDCIQYYTSENNNATQAEVEAFVISQWQLSDLREINNENGCLPGGLAQIKSTTLPGKYMLQMEKMCDISTSKYSQLDKIRNVSNENVQETEVNKPQAWEPKGKRMMQLYLTDGVQEVTAIEYRPIRFSKDTLLPGYKVMIIGPVMCRRGVIMLEERNIKEIGGEVESLLKLNALENVLARALNLQENPDPYNDNQQNANQQNANQQNGNQQNGNQQNGNQQNANHNQENLNAILEDDFDIDFEELSQIEQQNQVDLNPLRTQNTNNSTNSSNGSNCTVTSTDNNNITRNPNASVPRKKRNSGSSNSIKSYFQTNVQDKADEFPDEDDELLAMIDEHQMDISPTSNQSSGNLTRNTGSQRRRTEYQPIALIALPRAEHAPAGTDPFIVEEIETERTANVRDYSTETSDTITSLGFPAVNSTTNDRVPDHSWEHRVPQNANGKNSRIQNESIMKKKMMNQDRLSFNRAEAVPFQFPDDDFDFDAIPDTTSIDVPGRVDCKVNSSKTSALNTKVGNGALESSKLMNNSSSTRVMPSTSGYKRPATAITPPVNSPPKMKCVQETPKLSKVNRKITEFTKKVLSQEMTPPKICDFICDVIKEPVTGPTVYKTVRGKVAKLSNLSKKVDSWYLEATITDGTASLDVTFASELLERILGFTVAEFTERKKMKKTNPGIVEELRKGFRIAEKKMNKMDALLEIELSHNKTPHVVLIKELTDEQKEVIDKRLKMLSI